MLRLLGEEGRAAAVVLLEGGPGGRAGRAGGGLGGRAALEVVEARAELAAGVVAGQLLEQRDVQHCTALHSFINIFYRT